MLQLPCFSHYQEAQFDLPCLYSRTKEIIELNRTQLGRVQVCNNDMKAWLSANYLKVNKDKTEIMALSQYNKQNCHAGP